MQPATLFVTLEGIFPSLPRTQSPSQFSPTEQEVFMQLRGNVSLDPAAAASLIRGHESRHSPATVQSLNVLKYKIVFRLQL